MDLAERKVAVLVEDLYQDLEAWYPIYRLREAGATVLIVGTGKKTTYRSKRGLEVTVDVDIHELSADGFDGVVIPGGFAPDILRCYDAVLDFVRDLFQQGKVVASICHGPWVLCSAGVLRGRACTSYVSIKHDIIHAGGDWCDEEVVVDGNLITSRVPNDLPAFLKAIITRLAEPPT